MRVEPAPHVFRNEDRRRRPEDRRGTGAERRADPDRGPARAKHAFIPWFSPSFGAHLLGQAEPTRISPKQARRAYLQPEARSPLRPEFCRSV
ncbi:MAG: hypothetical protein RIR33_3601 [Pseudomonadota bacterium]|jgi:hypothetical protein